MVLVNWKDMRQWIVIDHQNINLWFGFVVIQLLAKEEEFISQLITINL